MSLEVIHTKINEKTLKNCLFQAWSSKIEENHENGLYIQTQCWLLKWLNDS